MKLPSQRQFTWIKNLRLIRQMQKDTLGSFNAFKPCAKQELEEEIRDATTRPGVQSVAKLANQLNDAMKKLEDALAGNETVKQTSNYINEDTAQKGNYDHYVNQATRSTR